MTQSNEDKQFFQPQFRGVTIPADIWLLNIKREITDSQMKLLLIIDSLVKPKGAGCWASCEYLAGSLNLSERQIKTMMGELKEKGLLIEVGEVTIRNLKHKIRETSWSRTEKTDHATRLAETKTDLEKILKCPMKVYIFTGEVDFTCRGEANRMSRGEAGFTQTNTPHSSEYLNKEKKHPRRPGSGGENGGLLIGSQEQQIPAERLASHQYNRLSGVGKIASSKSCIKKWALVFVELLKIRTYDQLMVLIDCSVDNIRDRYCPKIYSPKALQQKMPQLEDYMERRKQDHQSEETASPTIPISDEAKLMANDLAKTHHWPKGSSEQLPVVVQLSFDKANEFKKRLNYVAANTKIHKLKNISDHFRREYISPRQLVRMFMEDQSERVSNWEAWSGKLNPFDWNDKSFRRVARGEASDYCGDASRWDELVKELEAMKP